MLGIFASCKKSSNGGTETAAPETIKELNFAVQGPASYSSVLPKQGKGSYSFIGYGYDVIGKYADTTAVKAQVIDAPAYAKAELYGVIPNGQTQGGADGIYGANAGDYLYKLSSQLVDDKDASLFRKTITEVFPGQDALSNKYIYARYQDSFIWKSYGADWNYNRAKDYLTTEFRNDVQGLSSENLIKKYGTHILSRVALGQKFVVYFQAKSTSSNKLRSSVRGFSYALKKVFGINSGSLDEPTPSEINAISEPKMVYEVIGGNPTQMTEKTTNAGKLIWYYDWRKNWTQDNAVFIGTLRNGLTPLDDMIGDPAKKAEVKKYIASYIESNRVKM